MGEVTSYTKVAIDDLLLDAELVGSDLVLTKMSGEIVTIPLASVASVEQADIDAAVAALIDSAPGTLNTLSEIATALGNDANLASTLTTAIAAKASTAALTTEISDRTAADALLIPLTQKGTASGVATLDGSTKIPTGQIPPITSAMITDGTVAVGDLAFDPATQAELDAVVAALPVIVLNNQTAAYSLVLADAGKVVELNNASALNLTIPLNATQAFPIGTVIELWQMGAGQVTVVPTAGVTLRSPGGLTKLFGQYSGASLRKRDTNEWVLQGDLA